MSRVHCRCRKCEARRVLLEAAAQRWGAPPSELTTEPSVVVHRASGRRLSYREIAAFAKAPAELPKTASELPLIGTLGLLSIGISMMVRELERK